MNFTGSETETVAPHAEVGPPVESSASCRYMGGGMGKKYTPGPLIASIADTTCET
jgi:hypothetical protein